MAKHKVIVEFDFTAEEGAQAALSEDELAELADFVLESEGVDVPCAVSVSVVSDEQMRELNAEWRGIDAATDVLSLECERPEDAIGICELGDLVLAPAYIAAQAPQFGNTPEDETRLLAIHGMLHLLGYDHLEDEEARIMESREDELLERLTGGRAQGGSVTRHAHDEER